MKIPSAPHEITSRCESCGIDAGLTAGLCPVCLVVSYAESMREEDRQDKEVGFDLPGLKLGRPLGEGGGGRVFLAEDWTLEGRAVAVKILKCPPTGGWGGPHQFLARFQREVAVLAKARLPEVVEFLRSGIDGLTPFIVMEYVEGDNIVLHARLHSLELKECVGMMEQVARAVGSLHGLGIIHRDLKPSNILVSPTGLPKVLDFGVSKLIAEIGSEAPEVLTASNARPGTVPYMSPEQAARRGGEVTAASDVFSLGVVLYELLTQRRPFQDAREDELEILRKIREVPAPVPIRPDGRPLDRGLAAILSQCLEKNPKRRYADGAALADDLKAWLGGVPLQTKSLGALPRLRRYLFYRRVPATLMLGVVLVALGVFWNLLSQQAALGIKEQAARKAQAAADRESSRRISREAESDFAAGRSDLALEKLARALRLDPVNRQAAERAGTALLSERFLAPESPLLRRPGNQPVEVTAWCGEGRYVAAAGGTEDFKIHLYDTADRVWLPAALTEGGVVRTLTASPGGQWLVSAGDEGIARFYDSKNHFQPGLTLKHGAPLRRVALSPDGSRMAAVTSDLLIHLWSLPGGEPVGLPRPHVAEPFYADPAGLPEVNFSPDSQWLVSVRKSTKAANVFNARTGAFNGRVVLNGAGEGSVRTAAFTPDSRFLAVGGALAPPRILSWPPLRGPAVDQVMPPLKKIATTTLLFDPTGRDLAMATEGGRLTMGPWRTPAWRLVVELPTALQSMDYDPRTGWLGALTHTNRLFLWPQGFSSTNNTPPLEIPPGEAGFLTWSISPTHPRLLTTDGLLRMRIWDMRIRQAHPTVIPQSAEWAEISPQGDRILAVLPGGRRMSLYDAASGELIAPDLPWEPQLAGSEDPMATPRLSADGRTFLTIHDGAGGKELQLHSSRDGSPLGQWPAESTEVAATALSGDGSMAAWSGTDQKIYVAHRDRKEAAAFSGGAKKLLFSASGRWLAAMQTMSVQTYDTMNGVPVGGAVGAWDSIADIAFSEDENWMALASHDLTIRPWEIATGKGAFTFPDGTGPRYLWQSQPVLEVYFSKIALFGILENGTVVKHAWPSGQPESLPTPLWPAEASTFGGNELIVKRRQGKAQLFDVGTGQAITGELSEGNGTAPSTISSAAMAKAAPRMVTAGHEIRVWDLFRPGGPVPAWFPDFLEQRSALVQGTSTPELTALKISITQAKDSPSGRLAHWFLDSASVSPYSHMKQADLLLRAMAPLPPMPFSGEQNVMNPAVRKCQHRAELNALLHETSPGHPVALLLDEVSHGGPPPPHTALTAIGPHPAERLCAAELLLSAGRFIELKQFLNPMDEAGKSTAASPPENHLARYLNAPATLPMEEKRALGALAAISLFLKEWDPQNPSFQASTGLAMLLSLEAGWSCEGIEAAFAQIPEAEGLSHQWITAKTPWSLAPEDYKDAADDQEAWMKTDFDDTAWQHGTWQELQAAHQGKDREWKLRANLHFGDLERSPMSDYSWLENLPLEKTLTTIGGLSLTKLPGPPHPEGEPYRRAYPVNVGNGRTALTLSWKGPWPANPPSFCRSDAMARWGTRDVTPALLAHWIESVPGECRPSLLHRLEPMVRESSAYWQNQSVRRASAVSQFKSSEALDLNRRQKPGAALAEYRIALRLMQFSVETRAVQPSEILRQLPQLEALAELQMDIMTRQDAEETAGILYNITIAASKMDATSDIALETQASIHDFLGRIYLDLGRPARAAELWSVAASHWETLCSRRPDQNPWLIHKIKTALQRCRVAMNPESATALASEARRLALGYWKNDPAQITGLLLMLESAAGAAWADFPPDCLRAARTLATPQAIILETKAGLLATPAGKAWLEYAEDRCGKALADKTLTETERIQVLLARAECYVKLAGLIPPDPVTLAKAKSDIGMVQNSLRLRVPEKLACHRLWKKIAAFPGGEEASSMADQIKSSLETEGRWWESPP